MTKLHGAAMKFVEGPLDVSQFSTASPSVCSTPAASTTLTCDRGWSPPVVRQVGFSPSASPYRLNSCRPGGSGYVPRRSFLGLKEWGDVRHLGRIPFVDGPEVQAGLAAVVVVTTKSSMLDPT